MDIPADDSEAPFLKKSEEVLAELCANAPTTEVRNGLRKYKFGSYKAQFSSLAPLGKALVIETLAYLGSNRKLE